MRIISGTHRGRRIEAPEGLATRPMLDRMRESLFSILGPWLADEPRVLDLFAGSGCLALEALSRGGRSARIVERDPATAQLIERNVASLEVHERAEVLCADALARSSWGDQPPDLIFFDPPYPLLDEARSRMALLDAVRTLLTEHAAPEAVLVFHVPANALREDELGLPLVARERRVGSGTLWFVQHDG